MSKGGNRGAPIPMDSVYDVTEVTPDDGSDLADGATRFLLLGAAGTIRVTMRGGTVVNFASGALTAGYWHKMQVVKVHATGTSATGIKAGY